MPDKLYEKRRKVHGTRCAKYQRKTKMPYFNYINQQSTFAAFSMYYRRYDVIEAHYRGVGIYHYHAVYLCINILFEF